MIWSCLHYKESINPRAPQTIPTVLLEDLCCMDLCREIKILLRSYRKHLKECCTSVLQIEGNYGRVTRTRFSFNISLVCPNSSCTWSDTYLSSTSPSALQVCMSSSLWTAPSELPARTRLTICPLNPLLLLSQ